MRKQYRCDACGKTPLSKDEVAACKRLLGDKIHTFFCLTCLAEEIGYDLDELEATIERLKEEGCKYFS